MNTYTKRIAFLIKYEQFSCTGGIGSFAKSMADLCKSQNWKMDIIIDGVSRHQIDFVAMLEDLGVSFYYPTNPISKQPHAEYFSFDINYSFEIMLNVRSAFINALQENWYDLIIINSVDTIPVVHQLGTGIPAIVYTHDPMCIPGEPGNDPYLESYKELFKLLSYSSAITVGTQTELNCELLTKEGYKAVTLPLPLTDYELLSEPAPDRSGVLFIGRWQERKQPQDFIDLIAATGLPAKVMASAKSARLMKEKLDALGARSIVKSSLTGQEKVDFIKSAKILFMPTTSESYGLALMECMCQMPSMVYDYSWVKNFEKDMIFITNKEEAAALALKLYNEDYDYAKRQEYIKDLDSKAKQSWIDYINSVSITMDPNAKPTASKLNKMDNFYLADYVKQSGRLFNQADTVSMVNTLSKWHRIYTDSGTWFTTDGTPPSEVVKIDELETSKLSRKVKDAKSIATGKRNFAELFGES